MIGRFKRHIGRSFSAKIIMLVITNIVVTSLVIGFATMHSTENFLASKMSERFPSILSNTKGKVELWYSRKYLDLSVLSRSQTFLDNLEGYFSSLESGVKAQLRSEINRYFMYVKERFPVYEEFAILDGKGEIIAATSQNAYPDAELLKSLREEHQAQMALSEAIVLEDRSQLCQWLLVPIEISGEPRATICGRIGLITLEDLLSDVSLAVGGDLYLLDLKGCFLTEPRTASDSMLGLKAMEVPIRQEGPPIVEKYSNYAGKKVLGSKVFLPQLAWWLVCEEDYEAAMSPMLGIRRRIFIADLFIGAFFIVAALRIVRPILRPIRALDEGAKKIKEGMVGVSISPSSDDEIGLMISTFNEMAEEISLARVKLQAQNKVLNDQNEQLQRLNERLEELSITDGLTGLYNHRHFWNIMNTELAKADRYKGSLALILFDIDDFKKINDRFGHWIGDMLLQSIGSTVKETIRETDIVARYGGEEFGILFPDTNQTGVLRAAEKLREAIESMVFKVPETDITLSVTVSIGVSMYTGNRKEFFNAADRALYFSKHEGKNRVSFLECV